MSWLNWIAALYVAQMLFAGLVFAVGWESDSVHDSLDDLKRKNARSRLLARLVICGVLGLAVPVALGWILRSLLQIGELGPYRRLGPPQSGDLSLADKERRDG